MAVIFILSHKKRIIQMYEHSCFLLNSILMECQANDPALNENNREHYYDN